MKVHLRRVVCAGMLAACVLPGFCRAAEAGVADKEIAIGQVIALTGPLADITPDIVNGAQAWFDLVNGKGGINGRKVRLVTLDDGYVPANTVKAAHQLIDEDHVFALLNVTGTGNVAAIAPLLEQEKPPVPLFGPITGADQLRDPAMTNLFHIRASYGDEVEKIVQHLSTLGIQRISVVYLDNGLGKSGLAGVQKAM